MSINMALWRYSNILCAKRLVRNFEGLVPPNKKWRQALLSPPCNAVIPLCQAWSKCRSWQFIQKNTLTHFSQCLHFNPFESLDTMISVIWSRLEIRNKVLGFYFPWIWLADAKFVDLKVTEQVTIKFVGFVFFKCAPSHRTVPSVEHISGPNVNG